MPLDTDATELGGDDALSSTDQEGMDTPNKYRDMYMQVKGKRMLEYHVWVFPLALTGYLPSCIQNG